MSNLPVLSIITLAPFLGAVVIMFWGKNRARLVHWIAASTTFISLIFSFYIWINYDKAAKGFQFMEKVDLVPSLGITYGLGVDGISMPLVLLTSLVIFCGVFASWTVKERFHEFYALLMILVTGVFGVFVSLDLFILFLFYEIAVLPMYLLIGIWGSSKKIPGKGPFGRMMESLNLGRKEYAAMKLTLYLLFGSAFILVGILALYFQASQPTFSLLELEKLGFPIGFQHLFFLAMYVGFGILAGIWPFHTWSPDGHASAPTAVSMLHAGVLMKLGAYGVIRVGMSLLPEGAQYWVYLMGTIAVINIVYGSLSAMAQTDLKYVIAYSSVSHMGIVMLGAATLTETGINGAVFQMVAHGIMTGLFFALVGLVYEKSHTREIGEMGGFGKKMPGVAAAFTIGGLSSLGLPGLSGFVAEFMAFVGTWKGPALWWLFPAVVGTFITAVYVLRVVKKIFFGPVDETHYASLPDARGPEWVTLVVLGAGLVFFGIFPFTLLDPIDVSVIDLVTKLGGVLQ